MHAEWLPYELCHQIAEPAAGKRLDDVRSDNKHGIAVLVFRSRLGSQRKMP